jgi:hypothetical protein
MTNNKNIRTNIIDTIRKNKKQIEEDNSINGWDIMTPEYFTGMGFNSDLVKKATGRSHSGTGKYQLYLTSGKPVKYIDGVNYLDFLRMISYIVDPKFRSDKMGRGSEAKGYVKNLIKNI